MKTLNKKVLGLLLLATGIRIFISSYDLLYEIFFVDDAFYYFTIARNIASGLGITYDGIQETNGFQPLFLMLIVPFFLLGKGESVFPLHLVSVFSSLVSAGIGILLYKMCKRLMDEWYALFTLAVWLFSPMVIDKELNGMETGLNLFLISAATYYYATQIGTRLPNPRGTQVLALGTLLGLVVLSRLDGIILVAVIALHLAYRGAKHMGGKAWLTWGLRWIVPLVGVIAIFVVPWMLFNYRTSGSIIPTSGQAVRYMSLNYGFDFLHFRFATDQTSSFLHDVPVRYYLENISFSAIKFVRHLPYTSYIAGKLYDGLAVPQGLSLLSESVTRVLVAMAILAFFCFVWRSFPCPNRAFRILLVYSILLVGAYSFYVFGQWFYHRYYFPVVFTGTIWGGHILFSIDSRIGTRITIRRIFKVCLVLTLAILYLLQWGQVFSERHKNQNLTFHKMVTVVDNKCPSDAVIGCFQSGILGYYSNRRVVNLDGVVNQEALAAMKGNRLGEYVAREGITYIADWAYVLDALFFRHLGASDRIKEVTPIHRGFFHIYKIEYGAH